MQGLEFRNRLIHSNKMGGITMKKKMTVLMLTCAMTIVSLTGCGNCPAVNQR